MRTKLQYLMAALAAAGTLFTASCKKDSPVEPLKAASIVAVSGSGQTARINVALTNALVVKVLDQHGAAFSGASVTFTAIGGGTVTGNATTNASGNAQTNWTLGSAPGSQSVNACVAGVTTCATFTATATVPIATSLQKLSGDGQTAAGNTAFATKPSVKVLDETGATMAGVSVTFTVTGGSGSITGGSATTNATGIATVGNWLAGPIGGIHKLRAAAAGITNTVEFTSTGTPATIVNTYEGCVDWLTPPAAVGRPIDECQRVTLETRADSSTGTTVVKAFLQGTQGHTANQTSAASVGVDLVSKAGVTLGAITGITPAIVQPVTQFTGGTTPPTLANSWFVTGTTTHRISSSKLGLLQSGVVGCNNNVAINGGQMSPNGFITFQTCMATASGGLTISYVADKIWTANDVWFRLQFVFINNNQVPNAAGSNSCAQPGISGAVAPSLCINPPAP
ncbi:MAG: adhesin/invasin [Candidatus Doudnabacteria bacterium Gr01-1014_77]|uniref:Adhesin/invasin n=1 Tax=Candidatus Doudnabacteria bacterium Gr01-1014_77 TaxID=2017133 RepID=A0A554JED1_9BACT|nr:MAG: adhesin/invasin [Candidatus Doudnabacteria bacterium Gr01-1014_77]